MQLSEKQLEDFKELYFKHFGKKLSNQEALDNGLKLVNLMKAILPKNTRIVDKNSEK